MSQSQINEKIIKCIIDQCKNNRMIEKFLLDLLIEEIEHSGFWHWKETYRKKIKEYLETWGSDNEN